MKIDAGQLDRLVEVWAMVEAERNSFGERPKTAQKLFSCFAKKIEPSGNAEGEKEQDNIQIVSTAHVVFVVRFDARITELTWLRLDGVSHQVAAKPREIGRKQFLEIVTQVKDNKGGQL